MSLEELKRRVRELEQTQEKPVYAAWVDNDAEYQAILDKYGNTHKVVVVCWEE